MGPNCMRNALKHCNEGSEKPESSQTEEQGGENEKPENRPMEEAVVIWNMAQEMGVTSDTEQGVIIRKIKDMEERDKKEAQRLGEGRHIP